jgi:hypothetical protein
MDEETQHHRSYLFTLRLWLEDVGDGRTEWRGKAQYIPNGEICYFREWPVLLAFLQKRSPGAKDRPDHESDGKERFESGFDS